MSRKFQIAQTKKVERKTKLPVARAASEGAGHSSSERPNYSLQLHHPLYIEFAISSALNLLEFGDSFAGLRSTA